MWNSQKKCNAYLHYIWDWLKPILQILLEYKQNRSQSKCDVTSAADFEDSNWSWTRRKKKKTLRSWEDLRNSVKFSQANSWKAHGVPFGAMVQNLEHRLMLISMIWRFQECHWDRWNRSGTLESISGEGCALSHWFQFSDQFLNTHATSQQQQVANLCMMDLRWHELQI